MGLIELHFHLLPGVDDGPPTVAQSLELAAAAVADGTELVVATPHVHRQHVTDPLELPARVAELRLQLRRESVPLRIAAGGELSHALVPLLSDAQLEAIAQGPPGRRWLLLEAPFAGLDDGFAAAADELRARGFAALVAHPERAAPTVVSDALIARERRLGSGLQLNSWSIAGRYGSDVQARAQALLRSAPEAVIASDAHGRERRPAMALGLEALAEIGERGAHRRADALPRALLEHGLSLPRARRAA